MKKVLLSLFALITMLFISGCNEQVDEFKPYMDELLQVLENNIPDEVDQDIELIDYYEYTDGSVATIMWESSNGITLNDKGRYKTNLFDEQISLTATIDLFISSGKNNIYEYAKEVKTFGKEDIEQYKDIIESYLPDFIYKDMELTYKDGTYKSQNYFGIITYESTNQEVITNDGKYVNQTPEDVDVQFNYNVLINGINIQGYKIITAEGKKLDYYSEEAIKWLNSYFDEDVIYDDIILPLSDEHDRVSISWKSSDYQVLSDFGELLTFEPNKTVTITAEIKCYDTTLVWEKELRTYNEEEAIDFIINRLHRDEIQQYIMKVYAYSSENYGFLPFYNQDTALESLVLSTTKNNETINYLEGTNNSNVNKLNIVTGLLPWDATGRTLINKKSTNFITIHDTGDASHSADWWNDLESSGNDNRQASWHFTVGDTAIYQHVPLEEVAWHAGDGSYQFGLNDTGVKYAGPNPEITIGEDHYLYINGMKSKIGVPIITNSRHSEWNGRFANEISPAGLYTCLGENGNYYMANVHASNYWENSAKYQVCTNGGNRNSIGIETCINEGVDYNQVMRNTANLVAALLIYFDLDTDRVLYHRHFSGKLCPQVMIENYLLDNFHKIIDSEYIIRKYFNGIDIKYESNNPDILSNEGKILKAVNSDTKVSYKVIVKYGDIEKTYEKSTIIKPIK